MAYSIDGLRGYSNYEFPHSNFYENDLTEILRMYKVLTEDYNTLVNEIVEAHRLYLEAQDFVERQERIFLDNQTKIMLRFKEVMDEANRLQQELVHWFNETTSEMTDKQVELEELFRQLNAKQLEDMQNFLNTAINEFVEERKKFEQRFDELMQNYQNELDKTFESIISTIEQNHDAFKLWIGSEFETLSQMFVNNSNTIDQYTNQVKALYAQLLQEYSDKLEITRNAITRDMNDRFDAERDTTNTEFQKLVKYIDDLVKDINKRIEEAKNINYHVLTEHVHVVSPVTHKIRKLQWALNEMWYYSRAWSIRAGEYDALKLTAEQYDNWQGNLGLYPQGVGIKAIDYDSLARWILLEKPDILEQVKGDIEQITYDKLNENADRIVHEIGERVEDEYGSKVVSLEAQTRILENLINQNNEYTAQVDEALAKHIAKASEIEAEMRATTSSISNRVMNLELTTSSISNRVVNLEVTTSLISNQVMNLELTTSSISNQVVELINTTSIASGRINIIETKVDELISAILNMQEIVLTALQKGD